MREIVVLSFMTVDGVVQGPMHPDEDTSDGFVQGGWAAPYLEEVMPPVFGEWMEAPVSFLFGRKTFDAFSAYWPTITDDPLADLLNRSQKYVVTNTLDDSEWQNSELIKGDAVAEIMRLKGQDGPRIQIHGSGHMVKTLLGHGLVDEFRLATFPVLLGSGRRLFEAEMPPSRLKLTTSRVAGNGVLMNVYRQE